MWVPGGRDQPRAILAQTRRPGPLFCLPHCVAWALPRPRDPRAHCCGRCPWTSALTRDLWQLPLTPQPPDRLGPAAPPGLVRGPCVTMGGGRNRPRRAGAQTLVRAAGRPVSPSGGTPQPCLAVDALGGLLPCRPRRGPRVWAAWRRRPCPRRRMGAPCWMWLMCAIHWGHLFGLHLEELHRTIRRRFPHGA